MTLHHGLRAAAGNTGSSGGGGGNLMAQITLTTCTSVGYRGPTTAQINANAPANVSATTQEGYQLFTAPNTGTYRFKVQGATGGVNTGTNAQGTPTGVASTSYGFINGYNRLLGAYVQGDVSLNANDTCVIVVGQGGYNSPDYKRNPGGGGGTFVTKGSMSDIANDTDTLLFVAGGAGGSSYVSADNPTDNYLDGRGQNASTMPANASGSAATNSNGSTSSSGSNAGGGGSYEYNSYYSSFSSSTSHLGTPNTTYAAAVAFRHGAFGSRPTTSNYQGGFGGGGHGSSTNYDDDKGGGGGYRGGALAYDAYVCGTGGNSYIISSASNQVSQHGDTNNDISTDQHGIVQIEQIS